MKKLQKATLHLSTVLYLISILLLSKFKNLELIQIILMLALTINVFTNLYMSFENSGKEE